MLFDVSKQKSIISPKISHYLFRENNKEKKNWNNFFRNKYTIISERHFLYIKLFSWRNYFLIKNSISNTQKKNDMRPRFRYVCIYVFWYPHLLNVTVRLVGRYIALKKNFSFDGKIDFFSSIWIFVHPHSLVFVYRSGWWRHCVILLLLYYQAEYDIVSVGEVYSGIWRNVNGNKLGMDMRNVYSTEFCVYSRILEMVFVVFVDKQMEKVAPNLYAAGINRTMLLLRRISTFMWVIMWWYISSYL